MSAQHFFEFWFARESKRSWIRIWAAFFRQFLSFFQLIGGQYTKSSGPLLMNDVQTFP